MQYYIGRNGQQSGPFSAATVKEKVAAGEIAPSDLAWCEGMAQWQPVRDVLDIPEAGAPEEPGVVPPPVPDFPASESVPVEPASRGARLGAWLLDRFAFLLTLSPLMPTISRLQEEGRLEVLVRPGMHPDDLLREFPEPALMASSVALLTLMAVQFVLLTIRGQTIGKMITRVRIVLLHTNGRAGFLRAVVLRWIVPDMLGLIRYAGWIFTVVDTLFIFRPDRRCLHDHMAGTHVIRV